MSPFSKLMTNGLSLSVQLYAKDARHESGGERGDSSLSTVVCDSGYIVRMFTG